MEKLYLLLGGRFSAIGVAALFSVAGLVGVGAWRASELLQANATTAIAPAIEHEWDAGDALSQQEMLLLGIATSSNPSAVSDIDPISLITPHVTAQLLGQYGGLLEANALSDENALIATADIAKNLKAAVHFPVHTPEELEVDTDTSYDRMLAYKEDLKKSFAPLLKNTEDEFELFAAYIEDRDPAHIERLRGAVKNYEAAIELTADVVVPKDAVAYHVAVLNSMEEFAATIDSLGIHADDPFGSTALLRTYNSAEQHVLYAFNDLGVYYRSKTP